MYRASNVAPWVIDALMGVTVTLALALLIATGTGGARAPDPLAWFFALGFGALMLLRRKMPAAVLVHSALGVFAYYTLGYPPIGVAVPLVAALFAAAEAGLIFWSTVTALVVFAVSMVYRVYDGDEAIGFLLGYESVTNLALFAAAIAFGYSLRVHRLRTVQQDEITRLTNAQTEREAALRMQVEREQISRELHDTIGHTMSVISLHAGVGAEAVGRNDTAASQAFDRIRVASTRSLQELRSMVRILREDSDSDELRHLPSLAAVQELLNTANHAGLQVISDISVTPTEISAPADAAAYRVLQESITNVIRHSNATRVEVRVGISDEQLQISVTDNGRGVDTGDLDAGSGMAGMRGRVRLLGGTLQTCSDRGSGFTVNATIPARLP